MQETPEKEATILSLSEEIGELLNDFQDRLDSRFERSPAKDEGKSDRPAISNVLDEILERLWINKAHLSRIMSFVSSDVLPKIN